MTRQELHATRQENELVLRAIRSGLSREEIATRLGMGVFKIALIERRLARGGLL